MALRENAVIYHFHDPELIPIAAILKTLGKRVIYDVHEDVPADIRNKDWIPRPLRPVVSRVAALSIAVAARWLDGIVTATPHIASLFRSHEPIVVQNFPMAEEALADSFRHEPGRLVYAGMLIEMRGAREMVRAMEIVGPLGARLTIVGTITPSCLQSELETMLGWRYIDFVGWQDRESLARTVSMASVGLVLFHPGPNHLESQPNKLFEYMLAGLAVVGSDFPHWRQFVERTGAGLLVDPQDPNAIAEAIAWLLEHPAETEEMGKCGRRAVLDKYSWEREADNLLSFYDRLSGLPSRTE
jgi:glycosyltransferase involved in cell wall biosynthesis